MILQNKVAHSASKRPPYGTNGIQPVPNVYLKWLVETGEVIKVMVLAKSRAD